MGLERLLRLDAKALNREVSMIDTESLLGDILSDWAEREEQKEPSGVVAEGVADRGNTVGLHQAALRRGEEDN
ncbi:hypothetical protein [Streptomyces ortus]|uniref:Uncharacterized protein n=1 Tax=Streptomyces ortus TaxID=2867268 RepID=A0ABT3V107_9ACTN|nr:hypothetical protein [Streptomyces ortus]MCX4233513.1 hypothetical protein [Streptomyces ortus]